MARPLKKATGVFEKIPGSGVWWIRFKVNGVQRRERVGARQAAIDLYRERKSSIFRNEKLPTTSRDRGTTVVQLGERAIEWYRTREKKDLRTFEGRMRILINSSLGKMSAEAVDHNAIDKWLVAQGKAKKWSPATYNRYKTTLSKAFALGMKDKLVTHNPARLVDQRKEDNERVRYLSREESTNLWATVRDNYPDQVPALTFALNTGARKSEQFALRWSDVDFTRKHVVLRNTKNGKTRYVQLNRTVIAALESISRSSAHEYVFASSRYDRRLLDPKKWFEKSIVAAGIADFTWHDLRHDFISRLVMAGVSLAIAGKIAGHGDPKITSRYAHLIPETAQRAVELLDSPVAPEEADAVASLGPA